MKWFNKPSKRNTIQDEFEFCVICGTKTDVRMDTPVSERDHYVIGCGQLCYDCFRRTSTDVDVCVSNESIEQLLRCCRDDAEK